MATEETGTDVFILADRVLDVARTDPERTAVIEPAGRDASGRRRYVHHSYAELSREVEAIACGLRELGVGEGTRTVFMVPPSFAACALGTALTRIGARLIWIEPAMGLRRVAGHLANIEPEGFVGIRRAHLGRALFGWGRSSLRHLVVAGERDFAGAHGMAALRRSQPPEPPPAPDVTADDLAMIVYTTGSTGPAKPTALSHRNFAAMVRMLRHVWGWEQQEDNPIDMPTMAVFWIIALGAGGTVVVPPMDFARSGPAAADPAKLLDTVDDCGVRSMFASPALLDNLSRYAAAHDRSTPSLQRVVAGGAALHGPLIERMRHLLGTGGEVHSAYGATESLPVSEITGREVGEETWTQTERGAGVCLGRPLPRTEARIIRFVDGPIASWDEVVEVPPGEVGELVVRGPQVSASYFRDEANTHANKIPDGGGGTWHRIGDACYLDERDRLWLCGRVRHRVETAGGMLFPLCCEPIFNTHPAVHRSALVGARRDGATLPVLCVELEREHRRAPRARLRTELLALAAEHPGTRAIEHILFHPDFPVDIRHNAKIERAALATWAAGKV